MTGIGPILFLHHRTSQSRYFGKLMAEVDHPAKGLPLRPKLPELLAAAPGDDLTPEAHRALEAAADLKIRQRINGKGALAALFAAPRRQALRRLASRIYRHYLRLFSETRPGAICVWNGEKYYQAIAVQAAADLGIPVLRFENGLLPRTTTIDARGINARNSVPRDPAFYRDFPANETATPAMRLAPRPPLPGKRISSTTADLPSRFLLLPFQIDGDTQILTNSPWIRDMRHFYREAVAALETCGDPELHLVFREHPSTRRSYPDLHADALRRKRVHFVNDRPLAELLDRCHGVATVNSTVGLEALLLRRKVITLGDACYNIPGMVVHAGDPAGLRRAFREIDVKRVDESLRRAFLAWLSRHYAVPGDWREADPPHVRSACARIISLIREARP